MIRGLHKIRIANIKGKQSEFPQRWEDLSPVQFIQVVMLIVEYKSSEMTLEELQLKLYLELADINNSKILKKKYNWLQKNVFEHLDKMNFIYKIIYKDDRFDLLSSSMQKKLSKTLPEKLDDAEAILARRFERFVDIDICFAQQLIPSLFSRFKKIEGYTFSLKNGVLETSLTALQYIDAINALEQYVATKEISYLNLLVSILYQKKYNSEYALKQIKRISRINEVAKAAVMLNFEAIITYLVTKTKYKHLFSPAVKKNDKNLIGMVAILYSLVEKGYGNLEKIGDINIISLFDLMLKNMTDAIAQMKASNMKLTDIADKMNITVETLNEIS